MLADAVLSLLEKPLLVLEKVNIYISPPGEEAPPPEEGAGGREEKAVVPGGPGEKTVPGGPEQGKEEAAYQDTSHEQPSPRLVGCCIQCGAASSKGLCNYVLTPTRCQSHSS